MIAWTDWKIKRIPDRFLVYLFLMSAVGRGILLQVSIMQQWLGFFVISIPLLVVACIVPGSIGGGDIKLMAAAGFLLGSSAVLKAFAIGVITAGIYVCWLLVIHKIEKKSEIALGPFLCLGMILVLIEL